MKPSKKTSIKNLPKTPFLLQRASLLAALVFAFPPSGHAAVNPESMGKRFATPEEAVAALRSATASADTNALRAILGPHAEDLENPDRIQATNELESFSSALAEKHHLVRSSDTFVILEVGDDLYPFPIPLVKTNGGWYFDTAVGKEELLNRRVGTNELATIPVMRAYVDAQREYASMDRDGSEILKYAQRLVSSPGNHDGLYWPADPGEEESPLGPLVANAQPEGYSPELREEDEAERGPYHGYYFKILTRQGKNARGGPYNYIVNGNMIGGFALVAWPAEYGETGIMTFIVNQRGRVFQKDLGPNTATVARKMTEYDPDPTWKLSSD
jgi:hypothetical protein